MSELQLIAENIEIQSGDQRIDLVGFDFDDYPRVSIEEIKRELRQRYREEDKKKPLSRASNGGFHRDGDLQEGYAATCGMGRAEVLAHGPLTVDRGRRIVEKVPSYGMDDLFKVVNEPSKPVTQRTRVHSSWGRAVWPNGGF